MITLEKRLQLGLILCWLVMLSCCSLPNKTIQSSPQLPRYVTHFLEASCDSRTVLDIPVGSENFISLTSIYGIEATKIADTLRLAIDSPQDQTDFLYPVLVENGGTQDTLSFFIYSCLKKINFDEKNTTVVDTIRFGCAAKKVIYLDYNGTVGFLSLSKDNIPIFTRKGYSTIDDTQGAHPIDFTSYGPGYNELTSSSRHGSYLYKFLLE